MNRKAGAKVTDVKAYIDFLNIAQDYARSSNDDDLAALVDAAKKALEKDTGTRVILAGPRGSTNLLPKTLLASLHDAHS